MIRLFEVANNPVVGSRLYTNTTILQIARTVKTVKAVKAIFNNCLIIQQNRLWQRVLALTKGNSIKKYIVIDVIASRFSNKTQFYVISTEKILSELTEENFIIYTIIWMKSSSKFQKRILPLLAILLAN